MYSIVVTTILNKSDAVHISELLISERAAASVQMVNVSSVFRWKGEVHRRDEIQMLIKCKQRDYKLIEQLIADNHPYETPEIIQLNINNGLGTYLDWIKEVTSP
ncbi:Divalent-cation tolerance protein CutA [Pseudovibrio axinellae]|uniref:Divalent-cation tolerance protein CutA n=1 Tax=Pseudovibrio axinellae TaxID=989403 RepID=A0A166A8E9_9HYPH|nr:divalent-cation tolerance protein CutA [Pseudovibrio axinellae]KZL20722.1 Divalent-cation tolerance protein CutA [Pseudovibrio axinellae]SER24689.1 divalent cation tolerance protein [Pseudovibrio axinellae]